MSRRIRSVKPEWLEDERLGLASSDARVMSIALMVMADDEGRGRASPVMLGGQVFPGLANPREASEKALEELRAIGFVVLYEVEGQHYSEIRNWKKHQKIDHPTPSKLPGIPDGFDVFANPRESSREIENPRASRDPIPSLPDPIHSDREGVQGEPEEAKAKVTGKRPRAPTANRPMPEGWAPNEGHRALATELSVSCRKVESDFRDGTAARGRLYADWDAAFRTWLRNARKFADQRGEATAADGANQETKGPPAIIYDNSWEDSCRGL